MAAKNLDEAIERALCIGTVAGIKQRLKNELRDFFAHKAQVFDAKQRCAYCEGKTIEFFNELFAGVPALKKD